MTYFKKNMYNVALPRDSSMFLHSFSFRNGNAHASFFLAVLDEIFPVIPLNPDSDKWLVTFCFWTLQEGYWPIGPI
jgi:hypothetical protein